MTTILRQLQHAFTQHDIKQSKTKYYNPYALARYLQLADDISTDVAAGKPIRTAITSRLNDRLLDVALKAVGEPKASLTEIRGIR